MEHSGIYSGERKGKNGEKASRERGGVIYKVTDLEEVINQIHYGYFLFIFLGAGSKQANK